MIRICFVCHGNICRSPMAEFIMKKLVSDRGLENDFNIVSRATHTDEIWNDTGNPIYPPAQKQLKKNGIPFGEKRAQLLKKSEAQSYDYFIVMDDENVRCTRRILGGCDEKIIKLMSFTGSASNVSDPWYTRDFDRAFDDIYRGCEAMLDEVTR